MARSWHNVAGSLRMPSWLHWRSVFPRFAPLAGVRPRCALLAEREAEMGDAGVEGVREALPHRRQLALVGGHEVVAEHRGQRRRRRLVAAARAQGDLRPLALRRFAAEIAHPMDEAPLTER